MNSKFVVIDLETTGNSPKKGDRIIQIGAVVIENRKIIRQFSTFVQPEKSIPKFIEELTGITDDCLQDAPLFHQVAPEIIELLDDAYFVAHNVLFDLSFLQDELQANDFPSFYGSVIDTVELARILFPTANSYKLGDLALMFGFDHDRPHQADSDALVTAEIFLHMLKRLENLPKETLEKLWPLSCNLKSDIALLISECLDEKSINYEIPQQHLQFVDGLYIKGEQGKLPAENKAAEIYPHTDEEKVNLLKKAYTKYEQRTGQLKMMDMVFESLQTNRHALIEAGPGVGKSMGYLLPAYFFAKKKNEPVVISTYTTQMQEQLMQNDLPLLEKIAGTPIKTAVLKGRGHYIHIGRFIQSLQEEDDTYDIALLKMQIIIWLMETETGDKDELNLSRADELFWKLIHCENDRTPQQNFYLRAKEQAQHADLIITNHSFLMADLQAKEPILPAYSYCIIDEGHQFEKAASKYFAETINYVSLRTVLHQFNFVENKQYNYKLQRLMGKLGHGAAVLSKNGDDLYSEVIHEMDEFFRIIKIYFNKLKRDAKHVHYYVPLVRDKSREWIAVSDSAEKFYFALKDLLQYIENDMNKIAVIQNALSGEDALTFHQIKIFMNDLMAISQKVKKIILQPPSEEISWLEIDGNEHRNSLCIYQQPIFVGEFLQQSFFKKKKSVVITSATLAVNDSFDFIRQMLGLHNSNCLTVRIDSPFEYEKQMKLIVNNDLPEVNAVPLDEYVAAISEHIISVAEVMKGRMLILFTSYEMLTATYRLIKESELLEEFLLIGQGITSGSRMRLTKVFQAHEKAILFGTSSFWEGVDIPGEDLSCLIIVRLPFSSPMEPMTKARCASLEKEGKNPFSALSLPEAVIRFKQGFGRLIRSENDRGVVIVFDKRLVTTAYGKTFLQSVPSVPMYIANIHETLDEIEEFL